MKLNKATDYEACIAGQFVALGDGGHIRSVLGYGDGGTCACDGLEVRALPDLWYLPGCDKVMPTESAAAALGVKPQSLRKSAKAERLRRRPWSAAPERIASIRATGKCGLKQGALV